MRLVLWDPEIMVSDDNIWAFRKAITQLITAFCPLRTPCASARLWNKMYEFVSYE